MVAILNVFTNAVISTASFKNMIAQLIKQLKIENLS